MSQAQWLRSVYQAQALNFADATGSTRWSTTELNYALGQCHMREWKRILNANRYVRFATRTVTQDTSGQLALSSLDSVATQDVQQRFYRVIDMAQGTRTYQQVEFADVPTATLIGGYNVQRAWFLIGDVIQCLPVESGAVMTVWVNHTPTPIDQLSGDTIAAEFPRDYEPIVCLEAAARLLQKGAMESGAAKDLLQQSEAMRQDMLSDLARVSTNPLRMRYPDTRTEWGG